MVISLKNKHFFKNLKFKTENFIKSSVYNVIYIFKYTHSRLKNFQTKLVNTKFKFGRGADKNIYEHVFFWLLNIIIYGCMINFVVSLLYNDYGFLGIFAFGILRWLIFDSILEYRLLKTGE